MSWRLWKICRKLLFWLLYCILMPLLLKLFRTCVSTNGKSKIWKKNGTHDSQKESKTWRSAQKLQIGHSILICKAVFALHIQEHYVAVQGGNRLILYTSDPYTSKTITLSLAQNFNSNVSTNWEEFKEKQQKLSGWLQDWFRLKD